MILLYSLLFVGSAFCSNDILLEVTGVEFNRLPLYNKGKEFMCLDGSKIIPSSQVNDDYCDCPDGSDEPGTSACPNGKFYCQNKGHVGHYMPSSRVNDRICDCCDGSDEYGGLVSCPNICNELGKAAREERDRQASVARKGYSFRREMAKEGQSVKKEKQSALEPMKAEKEQLVAQRTEIENKKKEAEEKEKLMTEAHRNKWEDEKKEKKLIKATALFQEIDRNHDQKIQLAELLALPYLDSNDDSVVAEDEAKTFLAGQDEADFEHFLNQMYDQVKTEKQHYETDKKQEEHVDNLDAAEDQKEDEYADDDNEVMPPYDAETNKVIEEANAARTEFTDVDVKIRDLENKIREGEHFNEHDFGDDMAWAPLKGQCFELAEMQYIYKICPFDKTIQKDKNGHSETTLGYWKEWSGAVPRKYSAQHYGGGQQCWNGPQRSTKVNIECGEQNELVKTAEPAKCEYEFWFRTPAACNDPDKDEPIHVEL